MKWHQRLIKHLREFSQGSRAVEGVCVGAAPFDGGRVIVFAIARTSGEFNKDAASKILRDAVKSLEQDPVEYRRPHDN